MPNFPNHEQRNLNQCENKGIPSDVNLDPAPPYCDKDLEKAADNRREINDDSLNWLKDQTMKKTGFGARVDCDPMQRGQIINDLENPDRNHIYRYSKSIRGTDEAIKDMFSNISVIDEDGKAWPIPTYLGPPEKAVAAIIQENVRKDETLVVERLKLPLIAITQTNIDYDINRFTYHQAKIPLMYMKEKFEKDTVFGVSRGIPIDISYTVTAWTMYREDMNQILEQILLKFSHQAYIRVTGVPWETIVRLDSTANNINSEPGETDFAIIKYEFNVTAQTYIPQPIERKKTVLKVKIDFVDGLSEDEITTVLGRIEEKVKELEC